MDQEKQLADEQQLIMCCQMKSDAVNNVIPPRQTANYKPSIWKYDFIQSLHSKYNEEGYRSQSEKLKDDVKQMFLDAADVLAKLELIDRICKLGLSSLFEEQIREALDTIAYVNNVTSCLEEELYATALCFKLLRQHGYEISQDVFNGFMNENGTFSMSKCADIKGLIELFEASYIAFEGESILDEAKVFSRNSLKGIHSSLNGTDQLAQRVAKVLELPSHWRVPWYEVRWQINLYEKEKHMNKVLLELAKLNFNMVQATLQKDLMELSRWWRNLGLIENLNFSRDRLVESFLCAVGLVHEPKFSCFRKWLAKVIIFVLVIDDIYDIYGSLEELKHFTNAVDRWDSRDIQHLPECMKRSFQALYETTNEVANEIQKEKGWNRILPHLRKVWADFCKALLVEAKWQKNGYSPSLQEYLSNAWISSSGTVLSVYSFFSIMNEVNEETANFLELNKDLLYNSSLIIRLCNDLGTSAAELERGDVASSILCFMLEMNTSEEIARNYIKGMISETWTKINGQCFTQSPLLQSFVNISTNFARVSHSLYQYGDGFGVQDRDTKNHIMSLLIEPMSLG
nr:alpha-farnesene synthase [Zanthoxylum ailanthoides]